MSRFRFYIFPRLCLALSALVLLGGLWVLWLSMGRPMPTQGWPAARPETARFLPTVPPPPPAPFATRTACGSAKQTPGRYAGPGTPLPSWSWSEPLVYCGGQRP